MNPPPAPPRSAPSTAPHLLIASKRSEACICVWRSKTLITRARLKCFEVMRADAVDLIAVFGSPMAADEYTLVREELVEPSKRSSPRAFLTLSISNPSCSFVPVSALP